MHDSCCDLATGTYVAVEKYPLPANTSISDAGAWWVELTPEKEKSLHSALSELQQEHPDWGSRRLRTALCESGEWNLGASLLLCLCRYIGQRLSMPA